MSKGWFAAGLGATACVCATMAMAQTAAPPTDPSPVLSEPETAGAAPRAEWLKHLVTGRSSYQQEWARTRGGDRK